MKKFVDFKIVTCICTAASILFLTFKLSGDSRFTWIMVILPFVLSLVIWGLVWVLEFCIELIRYYWRYSVFHATPAYAYRGFFPMYWDPITKQFYSPKYGLMEFEEEVSEE